MSKKTELTIKEQVKGLELIMEDSAKREPQVSRKYVIEKLRRIRKEIEFLHPKIINRLLDEREKITEDEKYIDDLVKAKAEITELKEKEGENEELLIKAMYVIPHYLGWSHPVPNEMKQAREDAIKIISVDLLKAIYGKEVISEEDNNKFAAFLKSKQLEFMKKTFWKKN